MKKIYVPPHRLATSNRTVGFPVYCIDRQGNVLKEFRTFKEGRLIAAPEKTWRLLVFYCSNSGRKSVVVHLPENGCAVEMRIDDCKSPDDIRGIIPGAAGDMVIRHVLADESL